MCALGLIQRRLVVDGRKERVLFDKITSRIAKLCNGLNADFIDPPKIAQKVYMRPQTIGLFLFPLTVKKTQVVTGMYQGITTVELDNLAAETAAYMTTTHPDYAILAARIAVSNLHKETDKDFSKVVEKLYHHRHPRLHTENPLVSKELYELTQQHADRINAAIDYERDYDFNFFGFKTLERSYLMRIDGNIMGQQRTK